MVTGMLKIKGEEGPIDTYLHFAQTTNVMSLRFYVLQ